MVDLARPPRGVSKWLVFLSRVVSGFFQKLLSPPPPGEVPKWLVVFSRVESGFLKSG